VLELLPSPTRFTAMKISKTKKDQLFFDHQDVLRHMKLGEKLVLARRRIHSYKSCYEFIHSFCDPFRAKEYAEINYLARDKYVMLFWVTKSRLRDLPL
jgi:hypothetical protein